MTTEDRSFLADGPTPRAFETGGNNTGIEFGVNVQGTRCGVYGESVKDGGAGRDSDIPGVGVCGKGDFVSIFGQGNHGKMGVLGTQNSGGVGVFGAVIRGGNGVVGLSVDSIDPAALVDPLPVADGSGTGVFGASGSGRGVQGVSGSSRGVEGNSTSGAGIFGTSVGGPGVSGASGSDRGGVFSSFESAQLNLVPIVNPTPGLPQFAQFGDVYLRLTGVPDPNGTQTIEMFLCIFPGSDETDPARWAPFQFGPFVRGGI